ncbi:SusD/RagB family nutrient-binding outer membrane lipoprotein [Pedobacter sp. SYSU D00535]|uniref:SusD/RagB family nutrient-binding outer membrane lipoprotein n=1 Tax=Pedobacter sp. SYSU D00535 TaxID=2810308 RepID=UPI001A964937|nr:SusD/RagB family nutrient-binding outer membrane lipoprotein [Pedobacter sp. SYSU D00535]
MTIFKKFTIAAIIGLSSLHTSCTDEFAELNTDPNRLDQVSPGTLLNPIIYEVASFNTERSDAFTFDLMQVSLPFPSVSGGIHRYDVSESAGNSTWNTYYRWLKNIDEMEAAAEAVGDPNYKAIALTLNAWVYSLLTDSFGDVPMEEAGKGDEKIYRPAFNTQKEIYTKILADLETANTLFDPTKTLRYGTDILYAVNTSGTNANQLTVDKWRKFCNSLRLRLLLRVSNKPEMNAAAKMAEIVNNPTQHPVFGSNDDSAILKITGVTPNISPWGRSIDFTNARATAEFFIGNLNNFDDPRRAKWITAATRLNPATNKNESIGYKGIPSAFAGSSTFDYTPSNMLRSLVEAPMISVLMTYAEVEFIKAELAFKGIIASDPRTHYEKGVKASIEQWGAVMPADYFTKATTATHTAYNGTLERIMLQKYYALFFNDYQQWFEYRRTGLPVLPKGAGLMNNGVMPVRFKYPTTVASLNRDNYLKAVQNMGGDDINTKVWWEK